MRRVRGRYSGWHILPLSLVVPSSMSGSSQLTGRELYKEERPDLCRDIYKALACLAENMASMNLIGNMVGSHDTLRTFGYCGL